MTEQQTTPKPAKPTKGHDIVVNAEPYSVEDSTVTYEQLVGIAFPTLPSPDTRFTVSFRNAKKPKEGTLSPGNSVEVKREGTIFNVKATGKS